MVARIVLAAACVALGSGCGGGYGRDLDGLSVVTGVYPLAWAADEVGQARVDVLNVTPAGSEPQNLELSPQLVELVHKANFVFLLRGFQPALDDAADGAESARVVDFLAGASPRELGGETDAHVWLDPLRFAEIVRRMGEELERPAPAARLVSRLRALDRDFERGLANCERREIVTSHAAFGYLAERYGLVQIGVPVDRVVEQVRARGATTVFVEPGSAWLARRTGVRTAVLDPIESLSEAEGRRGETYLTVMRENLAALRRGLGCR